MSNPLRLPPSPPEIAALAGDPIWQTLTDAQQAKAIKAVQVLEKLRPDALRRAMEFAERCGALFSKGSRP